MVFTSAIFLFVFLPLALGIYFGIPMITDRIANLTGSFEESTGSTASASDSLENSTGSTVSTTNSLEYSADNLACTTGNSANPDIKLRNILLLAISLAFYAWSGLGFCLLLMASTVVNYFLGLWIKRGRRSGIMGGAKPALIAAIVYNLAILGIFKYANFVIEVLTSAGGALGISRILGAHNIPYIMLPVGISFYTFQILSYQIDLYWGRAKVQRNLLDLGLYIMLFPQLIAGPIVRYIDVEREIGSRKTTWDGFTHGVRRFMIGFSKKILLADKVGFLAETLLSMEELAAPYAWLGLMFYAIQIYLDFSAYSDMAIGLGEIFGFRFLENFDYPFISLSVKEFWRRWHISLSGWFRDYVYIPLGGNRGGVQRKYKNLLIVFALTGIWHGAGWTFLIWGLMHGIIIILEDGSLGRLLRKLPKPVRMAYSYLWFSLSMGFFYFDRLSDSLRYMGHLFSTDMTLIRYVKVVSLFNRENLFFLICAIIACTPVWPAMEKRFGERFDKAMYAAVPVVFVLAVCFMMASDFNPFIYFRF